MKKALRDLLRPHGKRNLRYYRRSEIKRSDHTPAIKKDVESKKQEQEKVPGRADERKRQGKNGS